MRSPWLWRDRHGSWQRFFVVRIPKASISLVLALAAPSVGARDLVNVAVEFDAPLGCSDRETFAAGLHARSNRIQIVGANERGWVLSVKLVGKDRGIHGELRLTDDHGESELRAVEGVDCAEVVEALSLTAALAIEHTAELRPAEPSATEPRTPAAQTLGRTPAIPNVQPKTGKPAATTTEPNTGVEPAVRKVPGPCASVESMPVTTHVLFSANVTERVWPQTSVGFSLSLHRTLMLTCDWAAEMGIGVLYIPSDTMQPRSELSVGSLGAVFQACPVVWSAGSVVVLRPCAMLEWSMLTVADRSVDLSTPSTRLTPALGGIGRGGLRLSRHLELELQLGLLVPLAERHYQTDSPRTEVGKMKGVTWQTGIGWLFGW
jgi:hypothetical protein